MAKTNLKKIYQTFDSQFGKNNSYIGINPNFEQYRTDKYKFGAAQNTGLFKNICETCKIEATHFKVIAVGNLDDDPELDVISINEDGIIEQLQDDLGEIKNE